MINDHDIELHLAYWKSAINGTLRDGLEPLATIEDSAREITGLLRPSAQRARDTIASALDLSRAFIGDRGQAEHNKMDVLAAIQSVQETLESGDLDPKIAGARPPLPTRRPS